MGSNARFKCHHCNKMCRPDARNGWHQLYCSADGCRRASKAESQRQWLAKSGNQDYFRGAENVERVQAWRREHPGYWRKRGPRPGDALQDVLPLQGAGIQEVKKTPMEDALQDVLTVQAPLVVGLLSHLMGSALQEDIVVKARQLVAMGQMILGKGPGIEPKGAMYENQTSLVSAAVAGVAVPLGMGGSPSGA